MHVHIYVSVKLPILLGSLCSTSIYLYKYISDIFFLSTHTHIYIRMYASMYMILHICIYIHILGATSPIILLVDNSSRPSWLTIQNNIVNAMERSGIYDSLRNHVITLVFPLLMLLPCLYAMSSSHTCFLPAFTSHF